MWRALNRAPIHPSIVSPNHDELKLGGRAQALPTLHTAITSGTSAAHTMRAR